MLSTPSNWRKCTYVVVIGEVVEVDAILVDVVTVLVEIEVMLEDVAVLVEVEAVVEVCTRSST